MPPDRTHTRPEEEQRIVNKGGFSLKRAIGVTRAKQRISRKTGIPWTRSGQQRKLGRMMTGGGCVLTAVLLAGSVLALGIARPPEVR